MGLLTDSRAGAGDGQRSDWGRHARTRSFDTLPADSGHLGPEGTPRAPLHTHTRTHSSVAHTRSRPRVRGRQTKRVSGRADEGGDIQKHRCPLSGWEEIGPRPVTTLHSSRCTCPRHTPPLFRSRRRRPTSGPTCHIRPSSTRAPDTVFYAASGFSFPFFYFFCPFLFLRFSGSKFLPFVCRVSSRTLRSHLLWCCAAPPLPPLLG